MKNWSLNTKIVGVVSIFIFACITTAAVGVTKVSQISEIVNRLINVEAKGRYLSKNLDSLSHQIRNNEKVIILETDVNKMKEIAGRFAAFEKEIEDNLGTLSKILPDADQKNIESLKQNMTDWKNVHDQIRDLAYAHKTKEATFLARGKSREILENFEKTLNVIISERSVSLQKAAKDTQDLVEFTRTAIFAVSALSLIFGGILAFFILRALSSAIKTIINNLNESSAQVASGSQQIASSSEQLSQASTEQASSLEETAASVEEMNSMVGKNSENATSAVTISNKSQQVVTQGKNVIQRMIQSMEAINLSSEIMNETIKVIEQIDKKTKVINEIVNKTELLSFNASVEAARAGEHGKGFAVVAEEVGNLARMSGAAAEEIAMLLEESISKVNQMVIDIKKNVETGSQVARECGELFTEVVENVSTVSDRATEIASASQEQSRGISEITRAMTQLDQMTQQNAATSEECASVSEELSAQALSLKGAVEQLAFTINGRSSQDLRYEATAQVELSAKPKTKFSNVVPLKNKHSSKFASQASVPLKKTGTGTPSFDSDGFTDV